MKPTFRHPHRLAQSVPVVLALTGLALASSPSQGQSVPRSPVGPTWDCVLSGHRNGVAYLTFADDGTLTGHEVVVPTPPAAPRQALVSVAVPGNGLGPRPGPAPATNRTDLFGACPVTGTWGFDSKGRIMGFFVEIIESSACTTTAIPVSTNQFDSLQPIAATNVFPVTFSLTFPVSTNRAAGIVKNQTINYLNQVPVSTNTFEAPTPIWETNVFASGFSTSSPIGVNPPAITYSNQVTCYLPPVPLSTNTFPVPSPYTATNHLPSGAFCVTRPIHTNLDLITFTERMTRYRDHVPLDSSTFISPVALTQTNYLPDGTYCETIPLHANTFADTYTEKTVCYLNPVALKTNDFESPIWSAAAHTSPDGTSYVTLPVYTNNVPGSYTEQIICYGPGDIPLSTNEFTSSTRIVSTSGLPDGSYCRIAPIRTNAIAFSYGERTIWYASAPASTNTFGSSTAYVQMDVNPDGPVCITVPVYTNLTLITFTEQTTCYTDHVPGDSRTFISSSAFTSTNYMPDGTYYETVPVATNAFDGTFTEEMTCYLEPVALHSSTSLAMLPMSQTVTFPDGTYCVTQPVATNTCAGTYRIETVSYITQTDCSPLLTNAVQFTGTVAPGKRLTLLAKSALGGATYRGVPAIALPDISGPWRGVKHQNGVVGCEFFDLTDSPYASNSYRVSCAGADYCYSGMALLSSQKKIALACEVMIGTNYQSTRAVVGSFNFRKATANAVGLEASSGSIASTNRLRFQIAKRMFLP